VSMMPGMGKALKDVDINDGAFKKVESIIQSMTPKERSNPELLNMNRKIRIAKGCGQTTMEITAFIKQFDQMKTMMQQMSSGKGMGNMMKQMQNMQRP
ncbi:MAG: signal recognition particle protein, partial [Saprospiraceae bacterium]